MSEDLLIIPQPIRPNGASPTTSRQARTTPSVPFENVLAKEVGSDGVRFSKHAAQRMQSRGIQFGAGEIGRLNQAVQLAETRGCRDSLVLIDNTALVVSVKDSTVVTVANKEQLQGNLFTNIDSAIIA
ncbi:MAG: flagellar protein [Desulfuromonadaceae bacterium]|nr:flagellar protein [Desulfuromonadaceae bacterium]